MKAFWNWLRQLDLPRTAHMPGKRLTQSKVHSLRALTVVLTIVAVIAASAWVVIIAQLLIPFYMPGIGWAG